jgi:hypothetical protein
VFFGHKISGKVEEAKHNEVIELPRLRPETFADFKRVLTDQVHGQNTNFSRIDNLCLAFLGAAALEDTKFQRMVVERLRTRLIALADVDAENLYKKLLVKSYGPGHTPQKAAKVCVLSSRLHSPISARAMRPGSSRRRSGDGRGRGLGTVRGRAGAQHERGCGADAALGSSGLVCTGDSAVLYGTVH